MKDLHWHDLIVDRRASPARLTDDQFRTWMTDRNVFVSSRMDDEMLAARAAARSTLEGWGAAAIMWEALTPRDQHPERAYIEGVERSSIYVLLVGSSYGVTDESGYSPTHKEARRAGELSLPRLVFEDSRVQPSDRDGRLNDWLRSLYRELSTGSYRNGDHLATSLEERLREIAAAQETPWIKLGNLVFPGSVSRQDRAGETSFVVHARVVDPLVRHALTEIASWSNKVHADRLTWGTQSCPVVVDAVDSKTTVSSEDTVEIRLRHSRQHGANRSPLFGMTANGFGPDDQVQAWVSQAAFGEPASILSATPSGIRSMFEPDPPYLPEVLRSNNARGWLAEGLTRLYLVEGLLNRFGGQFTRLDVGPATATSVRASIGFTPGSHGPGTGTVRVDGQVPFT